MAKNDKYIDIIKEVLIKNYDARNNDKLLYMLTLEKIYPCITERSFISIFMDLEELGLPNYDTVTRLRRLIQAKYPELKANDKVRDWRTAKEEKCRREFKATKSRMGNS